MGVTCFLAALLINKEFEVRVSARKLHTKRSTGINYHSHSPYTKPSRRSTIRKQMSLDKPKYIQFGIRLFSVSLRSISEIICRINGKCISVTVSRALKHMYLNISITEHFLGHLSPALVPSSFLRHASKLIFITVKGAALLTIKRNSQQGQLVYPTRVWQVRWSTCGGETANIRYSTTYETCGRNRKQRNSESNEKSEAGNKFATIQQ